MSDDLKIRGMGAGLTAIGAALGWWLILGPWRQAMAGAPEVEVYEKAFFVAPLALLLGLAFLIFGARLPLRGADKPTQQRAGLMIFAVVATIGGLCYWWLNSQFAALGYS